LKKKLAPVATLAAAALALSGAAVGGNQAKPTTFTAALNVGQEIPHPKGTKAGAAGKFAATLTGSTLKWRLTFTHLSGAAAAAHIHAGKKGKSGAVLVPLCGPCSSPASGAATLTAAQRSALASGATYVNVHTAKNPNGEIRGQIRMPM